MRSKFFQKLLYNWQVKIICLLLAVLVYFVLLFSIQSSRSMTLPLSVTLPKDYKAESTIPKSVELVIQGTEDQIFMIDPSMISVSADFSTVNREGVSYSVVEIDAGDLASYIDTTALSIFTRPSQVKVYFSSGTSGGTSSK